MRRVGREEHNVLAALADRTRIDDSREALSVKAMRLTEVLRDDLRGHVVDVLSTIPENRLGDCVDKSAQEEQHLPLVGAILVKDRWGVRKCRKVENARLSSQA
jgi:hypothetical protein